MISAETPLLGNRKKIAKFLMGTFTCRGEGKLKNSLDTEKKEEKESQIIAESIRMEDINENANMTLQVFITQGLKYRCA
jgi:hypothetical protein